MLIKNRVCLRGYLMTPVLVINGKVVHHDSVPSQADIARWLTADPTPNVL